MHWRGWKKLGNPSRQRATAVIVVGIGRCSTVTQGVTQRPLPGAYQLVLRSSVVPARRPPAFLAAGLLAAFRAGAFSGAGAGASDFWLSLRNNNAPPPTASITGHSTRPTAPSAPKANAAAGVE